MQAVYVLVTALFISMVLVPPLSRAAHVLGLTDKPGGRKIHSRVVPRTGGIAIVAGALVPVLLWVPMRPQLWAYLMAAAVLFVFGVLDDRFNLNYRVKLLGQVAAAAIVTFLGGLLIQYLPFGWTAPLPMALSVPLTMLVLVALTNAVNLSDGLDGLAGGVSVIALGCLGLLAYQCGDTGILMVALAIMGATFGFLRFNTNPAQVFMGDTGSQFLGFSTAVIAIMVTQRRDSAVGVLVPILILGLPILDTLNVMARRIIAGRSPFSADRLHLHHQLIGSGLSQNQAVVLIYGVQTLLVVVAYLLRHSVDQAVIGVYLLLSLAILYGLSRLPKYESQIAPNDWLRDERRGAAQLPLHEVRSQLVKWPYRILSVALPLILVFGALIAPLVEPDIAILTGCLLVTLILSFLFDWRFAGQVERLSAYMVTVAVVYFASHLPEFDLYRESTLIILAAFGILTAFWVRFAWVDFRVTSLDVLILIIAISVPNLGAPVYERFGVAALAAIVIFYSIEVLLAERRRPWGLLRLGIFFALATITAKGL